jgi:hypothetical protein
MLFIKKRLAHEIAMLAVSSHSFRIHWHISTKPGMNVITSFTIFRCFRQGNRKMSPRWCNDYCAYNWTQGFRVQACLTQNIFKCDKAINRSTPSFWRGGGPGRPCRKILRHVKCHLQVRIKYFARSNSHSIRPFLLLATRWLLPESSGGRVRSFPLSISFHHGSSCSYITSGMNNTPVGGRSSETWSYPFDMIFIKLQNFAY